MKKTILLVGMSGSGKSYLAERVIDIYKKKGITLTNLLSYTTRKKRDSNDNTHIFVSGKEFESIRQELVTYTFFRNHHYGATKKQVIEADFYAIDVAGIERLKAAWEEKESKPFDEQFTIVFITASKRAREARMYLRGDSDALIKHNIENDKILFAKADELADYTITNEYDNDDGVNELINIIREIEKE